MQIVIAAIVIIKVVILHVTYSGYRVDFACYFLTFLCTGLDP